MILAGGRSTRFGSDKLMAPLDGQPILGHVMRAVSPFCQEVILSVADPDRGRALLEAIAGRSGLPVRIAVDEVPGGGPLVGLASAAAAAGAPRILVVGGDMPRVRGEILERLLRWPEGLAGACLEMGGTSQPLPLAADREAAIRAARTTLDAGRRGLWAFLARLGPERVSESEWRALDPAGASLADVDAPEDIPTRRMPRSRQRR